MPGASKRSARTDRTQRLLDGLASAEPAPAGGSASAACVALAAALLEKVATLSTRQWDGAVAAGEQAHRLRVEAEELIDLDVRAYLDFVEARRSGEGLAEAEAATVDVPLRIGRAAMAAVELAHELALHGNRNLRPDATTSAILSHAAISAAAMIIQVNVGMRVKDERLQEALELMRDASESVRRRGARALEDGRGRDRARREGSPRQ